MDNTFRTTTGPAREPLDFTKYDANVRDLEHVYTIAVECDYRDVINDIIAEIGGNLLPLLDCLMRVAGEDDRAELELRHYRLRKLLRCARRRTDGQPAVPRGPATQLSDDT